MEIASLVISVVSIIFTGVTIIWSIIDRHNRSLKYKICSYILGYYAPTYLHDQLPSSADIFEKFNPRNCKYKTNKIKYLLIELSHENKIVMSTDLSSSFEQSRWRPNVNLGNPQKIEITKFKQR